MPFKQQANTSKEEMDVFTYASSDDYLIKRYLIKAIELITGKRRLKKLYEQYQGELDKSYHSDRFWSNMLDLLNIDLNYNAEAIDKIPTDGPLIFVANHPFGVLGGIIMCYLARSLRSEFKILTNSVLCHLEETEPYFLPIDFSGTRKAMRTNIQTKNDAITTISDGGTVIIFPAGAVSTAENLFGKATDSEWKLFTARLVKDSQATVVPIYFEGQNSRIFQWASQVSQTIRLSLLLHEVRNKMGRTITFNIGGPIFYKEIKNIKKREQIMNLLREKTYSMRSNFTLRGMQK